MPQAERIAIVEAMRAAAAESVMFYHLAGSMQSGAGWWLTGYGWLGVDVFFVISGLVVPLSLDGRGYRVDHFPNFMARRLVRLEPAYLISIALTLALAHLSVAIPAFHGGNPAYSL